MPIFKCSECGNVVEDEAPPEKCACGAEFSYDEVHDFEESSKDEDEDDGADDGF
ncbi:MAG: hypothetical protein U9Q92_02425 [archaeon]|nr:hypothetical protein [archaeon]